ncbi:molybdenum cofactor biosysynthesis protein [Dictyobacter alpinus]|uniref:Molybdenum cofactor biosysynthesis protein n=1 Tax=Dictyobacter alpinus TaxID=2014873 RepID=A0A402B7E2_9CHLR|nr:MOSC domain-containing protein [Dictyobacter alpinus]GCE27220.1 molybdenum cofactor biosysynthesis protein [Dictyobacter alpinus]
MQATENMRIVSVNVAQPREVNWRGRVEPTGIFKEPVTGQVAVGRENLAGDAQGDLSVHGGIEQAIYAYSVTDYAYWRSILGRELDWGAFGENFTLEGTSDDQIKIGDRFRVGSAELRVTRPRIPCFKLANKLGRPDMIKMFLASGRTGFYFAVVQEGEVAAGDRLQLLYRDEESLTVREIITLVREPGELETLQRAITLDGMGKHLRELFQKKIQHLQRSHR